MPSLRSQLFKLFFRQRNRRLGIDRPVDVQRKVLDRLGAQQLPPEGTEVQRLDIGGIPAEWIDPPGVEPDRVLLYFHGGGYFVGSCTSHRGFVSRIAQAGRMRLLMPEYRLAPEYPFPAALEDVCATYQYLLEQGYDPKQVFLGGDSAGGGLSLALLLTLRDSAAEVSAGAEMPAGAILISPWTDLKGTGDSLRTRARRDPWLRPNGVPLTAARYQGSAPLDHPLVSPLYADLHGLPPLLIHVGEDEILLDDSTRLAARAAQAGVKVKLTIWPGMWHVFHAFYRWVPEAEQAYREIGAWVESKAGAAVQPVFMTPPLSMTPLQESTDGR